MAGFRITGLTLAQPGGLQGSVTFEAFDWPVTPQFQCQAQPGTAFAVTFPYTGTWNGNTATLAFDYQDGNSLFHFTGDFTADRAAPPPVFPMVVTASIGAQTSSASAQIQFRPQDLGRTGGVFVFASAPATRVLGGLESKAMHLGHARMAPKADPVPCVLAQKSPSGQLVAVTASQLQAIVTGSFTAAGAFA